MCVCKYKSLIKHNKFMFLNKIQHITTSRINHHEPICHLKCWANIDLKVANPTDAKVALANVRAQGRVGDVAVHRGKIGL